MSTRPNLTIHANSTDTSNMNAGSDNSEWRGRLVDVFDTGESPSFGNGRSRGNDSDPARVWIGVYYECCETYSRVYRKKSEMAYRGRCPKCGMAINVRVGPHGVSSRILIATPIY
jgi:hypothetical protein